jgi:hypothetical protein
VSSVKYELGFYIPEDGIFHSHRRGNLKSYTSCFIVFRAADHGQCPEIQWLLWSHFFLSCTTDENFVLSKPDTIFCDVSLSGSE